MGLLDTFFGTPEQTQALGLLGAGLARRNAPGGFLAAQQYLNEAPDREMKRNFAQAQLANMQAETDARKAAMKRAEEEGQFGMALFNGGLLGGGAPSSASPGPAMGGASPMGASPALATPAGRSWLSSLNEDQVAGLIKLGKLPAGTEKLWEIAKFGKDYKQGDFRVMSDGSQSMVPMVKEGLGYGAGGVSVLPGAAESQQQLTLANELAKAAAASAGRVNLRQNPDGTQSPVPELSENQLLQNYLRGGGRPLAAPAAGPASTPMLPGTRPVVSPADQKGADAESIRMIQAELMKPGVSPADRASLQREIQRLTAAQSMPGFPTPTMVRPGMGYGKTTEQQAAEKLAETKALKQVEADVVPTDQRQNGIAGGNYMLSVLDQAIGHPGRETATGASGTFDPRNYLPGTNAKGFQSVLDQIRGGTFMQAYQNLKGGGQITEVEGKKAENAIARLNTAQGDDEFLSSLTELRQVINNGLTRQKNSAKAGGATGSFDGDNSDLLKKPNTVASLPKMTTKGARARDTTTGQVLVFNGMSWVPEK